MVKLAIHGAPRSGTTWLGEIINSSASVIYKYQPLFSYKFKSFLGCCSSTEQIDEFFQLLSETSDPFCNQIQARSSGELPVFEKAANPQIVAYKEVRYHNILPNLARRDALLKFIFIIRDPFEVLSSWFHAPREFRGDLGWIFQDEWRYAFKKNINNPENFFGFEKWKESALLFLDLKSQYSDRVKIVNYSELNENLLSDTQRIFQFLELPVEQQTLDFLKASTADNSKTEYGVYRAKNRASKFLLERFPSIHEEILAELTGGPLENFISR
jgi:hypothetical protein